MPHYQAHQDGIPEVRVVEELVESFVEGMDGWTD